MHVLKTLKCPQGCGWTKIKSLLCHTQQINDRTRSLEAVKRYVTNSVIMQPIVPHSCNAALPISALLLYPPEASSNAVPLYHFRCGDRGTELYADCRMRREGTCLNDGVLVSDLYLALRAD